MKFDSIFARDPEGKFPRSSYRRNGAQQCPVHVVSSTAAEEAGRLPVHPLYVLYFIMYLVVAEYGVGRTVFCIRVVQDLGVQYV